MWKKIGDFLKQPLGTGVLIVIATGSLQQWNWRAQQKELNELWKSQQEQLNEQLRTNTLREKKEKTIEEITVSVGKLLTASATIVGAHEGELKTEQLNRTLDEYHELQREWDKAEDVLKLHMRTYFSTPQIQADWSAILDKLGELDSQIRDLHDFNTDDGSKPHQDQKDLCRKIIQEIQDRLAALNGVMTGTLRDST